MDISQKLVEEYISNAIEIMQTKYGLKCAGLSEILSLRRFVIEAASNQGENLFTEVDPAFESVARLLKEHYSIDFTDLHILDNGKIQVGMFSKLVSRDNFTLDEEFKDYLKLKQEKNYLP